MRSELEQIETIERYLNHELSTDETIAFEKTLRSDGVLREAVASQQAVMQGIRRTALRQSIQQAGRQYHSRKNFIRFSAGALVAAVIATTALFLYHTKRVTKSETKARAAYSNILPALNEAGKPEWTMADSLVPAQLFNLAAGRDTVVETRGGMVLSIPGNAFMDASGKEPHGTVGLCVKEALDPSAILMAGLSTRSGNRLLETGGMFYLDARQGSSILKINPAHGIYAAVPSDLSKPDMQLFRGKRQPDGSIDWQDPQPISHDLLAVDILSLDFYPPDYFTILHKHGFTTYRKRFTDSIYYSLAAVFSRPESTGIERSKMGDSFYDSVKTDTSIRRGERPDCGINPAKIKTIWIARYQNTLLATREFEQRLRLIHQSRSSAILDLYVNNLSANLYDIDAMAARASTGDIRKGFLQFAARRDGKVKHGAAQAEALRNYYALKTAILTEAIAKTEERLLQEQMQADNDATQKSADRQRQEADLTAQRFDDELSINLESAYRQLGYSLLPASARRGTVVGNTVMVTSTGWCNVDRYVIEATITRTTLNYKDAGTGRQAKIVYEPTSLTIAAANSYDRLLVYLMPSKLSSYMSLRDSDGVYYESLNGLMTYDLVCIGIRKEQPSFLIIKNVKPQRYDGLVLKPAVAKDLRDALNALKPGQGEAVSKVVEYSIWDLQNIRLLQQRRKWEEMIEALQQSFFPCFIAENEGQINTDAPPAAQDYGVLQ